MKPKLMLASFSIAVNCLLLLFVHGCQPRTSNELTESQKAAISEDARRVVDSAFAAIVRVDPPGLMRQFASGSEATFSADGMIISGHDSISTFFSNALASWRTVDSAALKNSRIAVLSPDAAVVTVNYEERITDKAGKHFWNRGAWTSTLARRNGEWKIVDSHASHPR